MQWNDEGIVLAVRRHGEHAAILSLLTRGHGRHSGLVPGGAGRRRQGLLQPGNHLAVRWQGRLSEHLGRYEIDPLAAHGARWLDDVPRLAGLSAACAMAESCLPEREPHEAAFLGLKAFLEALGGEDWPSLYVHWELGLLGELGFGLDLAACAATGQTEDLAFVSPKSGRAVGRQAGTPYAERLLPLPAFLADRSVGSPAEVLDGLALTGYFFERHAMGPGAKGLPAARSRLVDRLKA